MKKHLSYTSFSFLLIFGPDETSGGWILVFYGNYVQFTQISPLRNQEIRRHVPFLNWNPHTIVVGQNA